MLQLLFSYRFGFVRFDDVGMAKKALSENDGAEVDGFNISLRFAEDRIKDSPGGGGRGGGFRGRGGGFGGGGGRGS